MTDNKQITIGSKLKEYFEQISLSQTDIANRLGVSQPAVSALFNGKPFGKNLAKKWGEEFGLKPNWLLTGEGEMLKHNEEKPQAGESTISCGCPVNDFIKDVLENSQAVTEAMKSIVDSNAALIAQQSELIATIRALAEKR